MIGIFIGAPDRVSFSSVFMLLVLVGISSIFIYKNRAYASFTSIQWLLIIAVSFIIQFSLLSNLHMTASTIFDFILYILGRWVIALGFVIACATTFKAHFNPDSSVDYPNKYKWIIGICILAMSAFYWLAFFPGGMTPDSLAQWEQAHTREFNDWHPIMITWLIMILTQIWDHPGMITIVQILVVSSIYLYTFHFLIKKQVPPIVLGILTLLVLLIPSFLIFSIVIWKDILYSAFLLFFTVNIARVYLSNGAFIQSKYGIFMLLLSSFGVAFFRHNGFPVFVITFLCLIVLFRKYWKRLVPLFLVIFILQRIITGPVFNWLDVKPSDPNEALSIPTQQIANIIVNDGEMSKSEREYFNNVLPIELWKEKYNPYKSDPIKFTWEYYDREFIFQDLGLYFKNYMSIVIKNPYLAMEGFLKQTALVWQTTPFEDGYTDTYVTNVYYGNKFGLENTVVSPLITNTAKAYLEVFKSPSLFFLWKPAFYHCVILLFSLFFIARKGITSSIVLFPWLLNTLSVLAALPAQDFRYLLASVFVSFFFVGLAFVRKGEEERGQF
ncbi:hypothetical protein AS180_19175 [Priestia veravalensis]|uniref:Glycosyltransferase RgtA/B/C/D-like domain-containing protein n=1 Tax=Priestia veravalensis TaxID=1414648 RepID=A0A0V8JH09_9BACI|nr:hypothetical protein AS180_19175 [Priestia veravalensis]